MSILLDDKTRSFCANGRNAHLTPHEYGILAYLMSHPNRTFTAEEIYRNAWNEEPYECRPIISVHIRHIREKIEVNPSQPMYLDSFWGKGYRYNQY